MDIKYNIITPESIRKGSKQLSREQANKPRVVTRVRNVVERVFAMLKKWRFFRHTISNSYIDYVYKFLRFIFGVINKYNHLYLLTMYKVLLMPIHSLIE